VKGFILTRQWRDTTAGIEIELWLATDSYPLKLIIQQQSAIGFCRQSDQQKIIDLLGKTLPVIFKTVDLKNIYDDPVVALYCPQKSILNEVVEILSANHILIWEADIKPTDRYLMERFITADVEVDVSHFSKAKLQANHSFLPVVNPRIKKTRYQPKLKMVSLDIETSLDAKSLYSIAIYSNDQSIVFMVDSNKPSISSSMSSEGENSIEIIWCPSEKECLQQFIQWFSHFDPDIIIGWHVVQFDLFVLERISQSLGVKLSIGRNQQKLHWREDGQHAGRYYVQVPGRVVLDGIELLRTAFYNFESFSLQYVSNALLGESKLIDHDDRASAIHDLFIKNKIKLAKYNLQDCKLVWDIFEKTRLLEFAIERSRITGLAMDRMGGSVASFEYAYLPRLHRCHYVAPNLGELESDILSPGGYVMRSKPGLYQNVLVLDFKSLYPSIIRTFNIDPYAFWVAQHNKLPTDLTIEGFNGASFSRENYILPDIIKQLWDERDKAKIDNNQPLSQAIKIIMNSFYGVLGSSGCRFFDPRVASSITLRGHEIIQQSRSWIQEQGYDVIYGDTDSVFVWLGNNTNEDDALSIGANLALGLNQWWTSRLKEQMDIESALEIEFETHYKHFLMPTIRGSSEGSKKRYAGIISTVDDGEVSEELIFKGLETVRTDWTELAKHFQKDLYLKVFKGEPYRDYICQTVDALLIGELDEQLVYKKKLRRPLSGYEKSTPPHVKAARKLHQVSGELLGKGDSIHYILTINGPEPQRYQQSLTDYQHYIDKQLKPIADSILTFLDDRFDDILDNQMMLL
jgi:DNA polymerase-2